MCRKMKLMYGEETMYIGICDDEIKCAEETRECCEKVRKELNQKFEYQMFRSGEELLIYEKDIDILFLDIEMQGMNGIDTMKLLESRDNIKNILFVSSHPDYVFDTFGVKTRGFICKPLEYNRFAREGDVLLYTLTFTNTSLFTITMTSGCIIICANQEDELSLVINNYYKSKVSIVSGKVCIISIY